MRPAFATLVLLGICALAPAWAAAPPQQPKDGPGGVADAGLPVVKRAVGTASASTFVYHLAGPPSGPRPVVVFFHAWGATNPHVYGGWIDHLARKGHLVLFPRVQEVGRTRPAEASGHAVRLVREALAVLAADPEARPDPDRIAFVGHLAGAAIALNVAAAARPEGLPPPKLVFAVMPGGIAQDETGRGIVLGDLAQIDPSTLIITLSGDRDHAPIDRAARRILRETTGLSASRKLFIRASSDDHGFPALSATLASPASPKDGYDGATIRIPPDPPRDPKQPIARSKWSADMALTGEQTMLSAQLGTNPTDSLDYLAYWKTLDLAAEASFAGRDAVALRNDPRLIDMSRWSDGWPVRRLSAETPRTEGQADAKPEPGPRRRLEAQPAPARP